MSNKFMTETIQKQLQRLTELQALINHLGDETPDETYTEYRELAEPLVQEFLPLVQTLAQAGLLTLNVRKETLAEVTKDVDIVFECREVRDNGSILLEAE